MTVAKMMAMTTIIATAGMRYIVGRKLLMTIKLQRTRLVKTSKIEKIMPKIWKILRVLAALVGRLKTCLAETGSGVDFLADVAGVVFAVFGGMGSLNLWFLGVALPSDFVVWVLAAFSRSFWELDALAGLCFTVARTASIDLVLAERAEGFLALELVALVLEL